jgi:hypothetical protein
MTFEGCGLLFQPVNQTSKVGKVARRETELKLLESFGNLLSG